MHVYVSPDKAARVHVQDHLRRSLGACLGANYITSGEKNKNWWYSKPATTDIYFRVAAPGFALWLNAGYEHPSVLCTNRITCLLWILLVSSAAAGQIVWGNVSWSPQAIRYKLLTAAEEGRETWAANDISLHVGAVFHWDILHSYMHYFIVSA